MAAAAALEEVRGAADVAGAAAEAAATEASGRVVSLAGAVAVAAAVEGSEAAQEGATPAVSMEASAVADAVSLPRCVVSI